MNKTNKYKHEFKNDWAKWFAVDKDGDGYEYEIMPKQNDIDWEDCGLPSRWASVSHSFEGDWKESLQEGRELVDNTNESAPNNLNQHDKGAKLDLGKNRLSLVLGGFANALQEVGETGTLGAAKYSDDGWLSVENGIARYTDAMLRHQLKKMSGEAVDKDSGQLHDAHIAWNALAVLELEMRAIKCSKE